MAMTCAARIYGTETAAKKVIRRFELYPELAGWDLAPVKVSVPSRHKTRSAWVIEARNPKYTIEAVYYVVKGNRGPERAVIRRREYCTIGNP